jgi:hypothetical protein
MSVKVVGPVASPPRAAGDVILALHLDQTRCGASEFEGAVADDVDFPWAANSVTGRFAARRSP